jgi:hypothetical protein
VSEPSSHVVSEPSSHVVNEASLQVVRGRSLRFLRTHVVKCESLSVVKRKMRGSMPGRCGRKCRVVPHRQPTCITQHALEPRRMRAVPTRRSYAPPEPDGRASSPASSSSSYSGSMSTSPPS